MPLIVLSLGLNGIGVKRGFLRGSDERYPLVTVKFIFFRAILLGREAAGLHLSAMFGLADNSNWLLDNYPTMKGRLKAYRDEVWAEAKAGTEREVERLKSNCELAEGRASKAESENYALRKVISICSDAEDTPC